MYGHGQMARDFTYVDDLIEAVVRLADVPPAEENRVVGEAGIDTLSHQARFRVVNIGGGQPTPLMDFIRTVEKATGRSAKLNMMDMQAGDVPRTYADPTLLHALTGYTPDTPIETGVASFVEWFREWRAQAPA